MFWITLLVFGTAIIALSIGVILQGERKELQGSCGGPSVNPDCCKGCDKRIENTCEKSDDIEAEIQVAQIAQIGPLR